MKARQSKGWVLVVGASLLGVLGPRLASAQTCPNISLNVNAVVPRFLPGGDTAPYRAQDENPTAIDYKDCIDDINLEFTLFASGLPCPDTLEVWAGTSDCSQASAREANSGTTRCWPVGPPFPMSETSIVNVRAQDVVAFISYSEPPTTYRPQGASACKSLLSDAGAASQCFVPVNLYFLAMESNGLTVDGTSAMCSLGAEIALPDGGLCTATPADAGPLDASPADTSAADPAAPDAPGQAGSVGCVMAPGQGADLGMLGGLGIAALTLLRRRRGTSGR